MVTTGTYRRSISPTPMETDQSDLEYEKKVSVVCDMTRKKVHNRRDSDGVVKGKSIAVDDVRHPSSSKIANERIVSSSLGYKEEKLTKPAAMRELLVKRDEEENDNQRVCLRPFCSAITQSRDHNRTACCTCSTRFHHRCLLCDFDSISPSSDNRINPLNRHI